MAERAGGPLRAHDLLAAGEGITRSTLGRLCARGLLRRVGRGLHIHPGAEPTENRSLTMLIESLGRHLAVASTEEAQIMVKRDRRFWNEISIHEVSATSTSLPVAKRILHIASYDAKYPWRKFPLPLAELTSKQWARNRPSGPQRAL